MIKVLLVDDHKIILDGLRLLIDGRSEISIVGEALTGEAAVRFVEGQEVDVVLLDIDLPDKSGFEVCKSIKSKKAGIKVIALTMHDESAYILKMIKMGVDGYILKNAGKETLFQAISGVMQGQRYFSPEVTQSLLSGKRSETRVRPAGTIEKLTRREKEILQLVTEEMTTEQIAQRLFISPTTVITHRKSLLRKLNAKNTAGLVRAAYELKLLD